MRALPERFNARSLFIKDPAESLLRVMSALTFGLYTLLQGTEEVTDQIDAVFEQNEIVSASASSPLDVC
jgi:hypothetical protein